MDNMNLIATSRHHVDTVYPLILRELYDRGFALWDLEAGSSLFCFLGMVLDGRTPALRHSGKRCWRLFWSLQRLLWVGGAERRVLEVVIGHLAHHFSLRPPAMSVLQAVYEAAHRESDGWAPSSAEAHAGLIFARGLVFQCEQELGAPACPQVFLTDASTVGYALPEGVADSQEVLEAAAWRERWRLVEARTPVEARVEGSLRGLPAEGAVTLGDEFCASLGIDDTDLDVAGAPRAPRRPRPRAPRVECEVAGIVPRLADAWAFKPRWTTVIAGAWRHEEHIVILEARTSLLGLRRAAGQASCHGTLLLEIGDNMTEFLAFDKGRSSSWGMNTLCRHSCALQAATGIRWRRRHIGIARNCANGASR